ncbi:MAG: ATP-binding protein, partial [Alphaproteobacteria bacterium]
NLWQSWRSRYQRVTSWPELLLALSFDVIQLSGLLYLTGGMANPFAMLLLAPVVVSAALLDFRATVYLVLLVAFCAIMITHFYLPLPFSESDFTLPALYRSGLFTALLVSCLFIGFYVWYLADKARQANAALAAMQSLLERDRRATILGSLAAAAAHKLGSPLNTIAVISHDMAATLKGKIAPEDEILGDVRLLNEEVERCRMILSELDRDAQTDNLARDVALPVSQMIRGLLDAKLTRLSGRILFQSGARDASREPQAKPLPDLKYALETLLDNADDFAATRIELAISWTEEAIEIEIKDDGPGFPASVLSRFGQPWNSSREGSDGHKGLGLFLAMTLIESLGGQMRILPPEQIKGAHITIFMPRTSLL